MTERSALMKLFYKLTLLTTSLCLILLLTACGNQDAVKNKKDAPKTEQKVVNPPKKHSETKKISSTENKNDNNASQTQQEPTSQSADDAKQKNAENEHKGGDLTIDEVLALANKYNRNPSNPFISCNNSYINDDGRDVISVVTKESVLPDSVKTNDPDASRKVYNHASVMLAKDDDSKVEIQMGTSGQVGNYFDKIVPRY